MKKIYLGVIGLVSVVFLFVWCNDSGIQKGDGEAVDFLNSFINVGVNNTPICGNWSVTTPATCTDFGVETRTCTQGGSSYTETKDIPKLTGASCNTGGGENIYTITFNANNGTVSQTGITGTDGKLTNLPMPTRDGYNFNGWYTATSGGTKITTSTVFSGNDTIYAQWTVATVTPPVVVGNNNCGKDGTANSCKTVVIDGKTWMAENLNYDTASGVGSWCYGEGGQVFVNNNFVTLTPTEIQSNCNTYGRLYNWNTAMAGAAGSAARPSGRRGICPSGWHLPSRSEWTTLMDYVGPSAPGKKLKSSSYWTNSSGYTGTDDYGFSALPGGYLNNYYTGAFHDVGNYGFWWTATENSSGSSDAYSWYMNYSNDYVNSGTHDKGQGLSVRCLKDD